MILERRRWWAVAALSASCLVVGIDLTILNVALPTLATDLEASTSDLQWFANSYNLVFAALLLPAGLLGDRYGRKRMLLMALVLFGAASVLCAFAGSTEVLIVARGLLGIGAAFVVPLSVSVLPAIFSEEERPKAISALITANAIGIPLGPIVGGLLLDNYWWGSVFLINAPLILIAVVAVVLLLPESRSTRLSRLDPVGVLLSSIGLTSLTYGLTKAGDQSWTGMQTIAGIAAGTGILALFVVWEGYYFRSTGEFPLIDLKLFRSASFSWGSALATLVAFAFFGVLFVMPQYFQVVDGADALGTGLRLLPVIIGMLLGARVASVFASKLGSKVMVAAGFSLLAIAMMAGTTTGVDTEYGVFVIWFTAVGVGMGLTLPAAMDAAIGSLPADRSGVGSALVQALRQVGGTIGIAVLGTVLNNVYQNNLHLTGIPEAAAKVVKDSASGGTVVAERLGSVQLLGTVREAFVHALDAILWINVGIAVFGIALAVLFLPKTTQRVDDLKESPMDEKIH